MAESIPVGTVCIVVDANLQHLGAYCTVIAPEELRTTEHENGETRTSLYYLVQFADKRKSKFGSDEWCAKRSELHPLYPPKPQALTRKDKDVPVTA